MATKKPKRINSSILMNKLYGIIKGMIPQANNWMN